MEDIRENIETDTLEEFRDDFYKNIIINRWIYE